MKRWKLGFQNEATLTRLLKMKCKKGNFGESRRKTKSSTWMPSVVTYYPSRKALGKIINENLNQLHMNDEVKDTFTQGPAVSFRTSQKLSSYLVRAKVYPSERTLGSRKCSKKQCEVCENFQNSHTFYSSVSSKTFDWFAMTNA